MTFAWFLVFLAIFLIGVTKSGFGSGMGLIVVPLTALGMSHIPSRGAEAALGLLLPLLVFGDLIAIYQYRRLFRPAPGNPHSALHHVRLLMPGTLIGVLLGGLLLWWFHRQQAIVSALMRIEIGLESILLVGLHWWRQFRGEQTRLIPEPFRSWGTGAFAGASSTLAHAAGPIIAMYLLPLHLPRQLFVGTCAMYFFILNTIKLPAYAASGQFARAELTFTLQFTPLVLAGALFGFWVNRRMSDVLFTRIIYFITFLLGWYMLSNGAMALVRR